MWEPTEVEYQRLFPAVYLSPLLVGPRPDRFVQRGFFFVVGELFGFAEHCQWFHGHVLADAFPDCPRDLAVYIKILPIVLTAETGNVRLVREIFALEQCRNCCPHVIRIADMFMRIGSDDLVHLLFEAWGLPMDQLRDAFGLRPRCLANLPSFPQMSSPHR